MADPCSRRVSVGSDKSRRLRRDECPTSLSSCEDYLNVPASVMPLPSSSPPLLPQSSFAELPSSPPLLPTTPSSATLPWIPATRKRQLSEQDCHISSDPLFSDDTSGTEDASRYQRPKRKRMIRGPWWEIANKEGRRGTQDVATPKQKDFSRNVDSGIWMGSDGSEDSTESTSCYPDSMRRLHVTDHSRSLQTPRAAPQQFVLHPLSLLSAPAFVTDSVLDLHPRV